MLKNTIQKGRRKEGQGFVAFLWKKKKKKGIPASTRILYRIWGCCGNNVFEVLKVVFTIQGNTKSDVVFKKYLGSLKVMVAHLDLSY